MRVLCLDPSGNYKEGEGTTGWALFMNGELWFFGKVEAKNFPSQEAYWAAVSEVISKFLPDVVVCESYRLFEHKAKQQSWSELETPQLIGFLRMYCWCRSIKFVFQDPNDKIRVADEQLVKMGVLEKKGNRYYCMGKQTVIHERDAIRHGIFYHRYGKGKQM